MSTQLPVTRASSMAPSIWSMRLGPTHTFPTNVRFSSLKRRRMWPSGSLMSKRRNASNSGKDVIVWCHSKSDHYWTISWGLKEFSDIRPATTVKQTLYCSISTSKTLFLSSISLQTFQNTVNIFYRYPTPKPSTKQDLTVLLKIKRKFEKAYPGTHSASGSCLPIHSVFLNRCWVCTWLYGSVYSLSEHPTLAQLRLTSPQYLRRKSQETATFFWA